MSAVEESIKELKEQQQKQKQHENENEDDSSTKNSDVIAKRRRQNREAQRAYRERKANRIQVLERSMGILQDMVTSWEKKYNDLKLQYDEQTAELNTLKLRLQVGDGASVVSDSSSRDMEKGSGQLLNRSANSLTNLITTIPPPPAPSAVPLRSTDELYSVNTFERIKKYMTGDKSSSVSTSPGLNRESRQGSVLPSPGVSKPLHLRGHAKDNSNEYFAIKGNNNYNSLLYMLDNISKKTTVLPPLNQGKNSEIVDKTESPSSSVTLQ